jgi:hypothetical protein
MVVNQMIAKRHCTRLERPRTHPEAAKPYMRYSKLAKPLQKKTSECLSYYI